MLTMRGPQFLLLFAILVAGAYIALGFFIAAREQGRWPRAQPVRDPYAIAFLRGGLAELVKVVALALTLRSLLRVNTTTLQVTAPSNHERVSLPIEQAVLRACATPATPLGIQGTPAVKAAADEYKKDLQARKLIADQEVLGLRLPPVMFALLAIGALGVAKITVALSTGHRNIALLLILLILAAVVILKRLVARRTSLGDTALQDLRSLFSSLKRRKRSSTANKLADTTMLASVFGVYLLPDVSSSAWAKLFTRQTSSDSANSCGSSSSCGSSGCGGGGGCGGCGS